MAVVMVTTITIFQTSPPPNMPAGPSPSSATTKKICPRKTMLSRLFIYS
ncbi:unnamed protein product, partial [Tuber aestivum]